MLFVWDGWWPVVWASGSAVGPSPDLFISLACITFPLPIGRCFLRVLGCSINIPAMVVYPLPYPGWRRQAINNSDKPVLPGLPWRALLRTPRNGFMKLSLVEWKVKHRKEIDWCTRLSHSCQKSRWERWASAAWKDLPGESRAALVCQAADKGAELDKSFWCCAGKHFGNKHIVLKGQKIQINIESRAKGMSEHKLMRDGAHPCPLSWL